jgi:hypothetical protein
MYSRSAQYSCSSERTHLQSVQRQCLQNVLLCVIAKQAAVFAKLHLGRSNPSAAKQRCRLCSAYRIANGSMHEQMSAAVVICMTCSLGHRSCCMLRAPLTRISAAMVDAAVLLLTPLVYSAARRGPGLQARLVACMQSAAPAMHRLQQVAPSCYRCSSRVQSIAAHCIMHVYRSAYGQGIDARHIDDPPKSDRNVGSLLCNALQAIVKA